MFCELFLFLIFLSAFERIECVLLQGSFAATNGQYGHTPAINQLYPRHKTTKEPFVQALIDYTQVAHHGFEIFTLVWICEAFQAIDQPID